MIITSMDISESQVFFVVWQFWTNITILESKSWVKTSNTMAGVAIRQPVNWRIFMSAKITPYLIPPNVYNHQLTSAEKTT